MKAIGPYICESCGRAGHRSKNTRGSFAIEIILWCCFILPGLVYTLWRLNSRHYVCPDCGGKMIRCDSPRGLKLVQYYYPAGQKLILIKQAG